MAKSQSGLRRTGTQKKGRQMKAAKKGYYGMKPAKKTRKANRGR